MKKITKNGIPLYLILITTTIASGEQTQRPAGNGLLKKRILEKRASTKVNKLIEGNTMTTMLDRLEGMNKLLDTLKVDSVNEALETVLNLQTDLKQLLSALGAETTQEALKEVKQVKSVVKQLTQLQTKLK